MTYQDFNSLVNSMADAVNMGYRFYSHKGHTFNLPSPQKTGTDAQQWAYALQQCRVLVRDQFNVTQSIFPL